jgi:hypothetical protein
MVPASVPGEYGSRRHFVHSPFPRVGQPFEVNYATVTYLQPARSWRPVLGIIWYQYF